MLNTLEYHIPGTVFYIIQQGKIIQKSVTNLIINVDNNGLVFNYNAGKNGEFNWYKQNSMYFSEEGAKSVLKRRNIEELQNKLNDAKLVAKSANNRVEYLEQLFNNLNL